MGISELWKIVDECQGKTETTIEEQAARKRERSKHQRHIIQTVGIDTNALMSQCIAATYGGGKFSGKVPLEIFFHKICHYSQSWSNFVFVFDGPGRPKVKRGKAIEVDKEVDWYGPCQDLIRCCGYHVHLAPGEAEAELAALNSRKIIDLILTPDSDIFVFGGERVLRSSSRKHRPNPNNSDVFYLYEKATLMRKKPDLFSPGGLLLMVLLLGGDYGNGVPGCGKATAQALAGKGFGESLYSACCTLGGSKRREFISQWIRNTSQELCASESNTRAYNTVRGLSEHDFPPNDIIDLYIHPLTSFSSGQGPLNCAVWTLLEPNIGGIARMALGHLGFRTHDDVLCGFYSNLWPGIFKRLLLAPHLFDPYEKKISTSGTLSSTVLDVKEEKRRTERTSTITSWYRVSFSTDHLYSILEDALSTISTQSHSNKRKRGNLKHTDRTKLTVWVPSVFLPPLLEALKKRRKVARLPARATSIQGPSEIAKKSIIEVLDSTEGLNSCDGTQAESSSMAAQRSVRPFPALSPAISVEDIESTASPHALIDLTKDDEGDTKDNKGDAGNGRQSGYRNIGFLDLTK